MASSETRLYDFIIKSEELSKKYKERQNKIEELENILKKMESNKDCDIYDFIDAEEHCLTIIENAEEKIKMLEEKIKLKNKIVKDHSVRR